jgi:hypothetical protein
VNRRPAVLSQVYVAGAVAAFVASFMPLWRETDPDRLNPRDSWNLWTIVPDDPTGTSFLGIVLIAALVALAVAAATLPGWGRAIPVTLVLMGVVGALMLIAKPGMGSPVVGLGPGAGALFGTCVFLALTAAVDIALSLRALSAQPAAR